MKVYVSVASQKLMYRGLNGIFDTDKQSLPIWLTPDKEYAALYADSPEHIHTFRVNPGRSFDFGYRTLEVHVKLEDIISRINVRLGEDFYDKKITRDQADKVFEVTDRLELRPDANRMLKVWEWIQKVSDDIVEALTLAGYDSIKNREGRGNDVEAFGLLRKDLITKV
jgi:hypothetical protein